MKLFKLDSIYSIVCEWKNKDSGFKHEATLLYNGIEQEKTSKTYYNRTWERFGYESVLNKIVEQYFEGKQQEKYLNIIKKMN